MSDDYTPSTDEVRARYWIVDGGVSFPDEKEDFDRWLASVVTAAEKRGADKERERIARDIEEARGKLDKVRETVTAELECLLHDDDDPVQCGWKRTVRDVLAILDGDNGR